MKRKIARSGGSSSNIDDFEEYTSFIREAARYEILGTEKRRIFTETIRKRKYKVTSSELLKKACKHFGFQDFEGNYRMQKDADEDNTCVSDRNRPTVTLYGSAIGVSAVSQTKIKSERIFSQNV